MKYLILILVLFSSEIAAAKTWDKTIKQYSVIDHKLTAAIIAVESGGNPTAVSRANAWGLMQLTRIALKDIELNYDMLPKPCARIHRNVDIFNPGINILAGSCFFKLMTLYFPESSDMAKRSYNAGPTKVLCWMQGQCLLPQETVNYVERINNILDRAQVRFPVEEELK